MATYTIPEVSDMLNVSKETVRLWVVNGFVQGVMPSRSIGYILDGDSLKDFCLAKPKYALKFVAKPEEELPPGKPATKITINYTDNDSRNSEGYSDPTAYLAMRNIDDDYRFKKLLKTIFSILDLSGFELDGRITLIDKKTGRIYK